MLRESILLIRAKVTTDLALLASIVLSLQGSFGGVATNLFTTSSLFILFVSLCCWLFAGRTLGLYEDLRMKPFSIEWVAFLKALGVYTLLTSFIFFQLFQQAAFSRKEFLIHCALIFILLPIQKLIIRIIVKQISNSENVVRKVLIVGAGNTGIDFYHHYVKNNHYGYRLTGFLDDETRPSLNGHYLGKTTDLDKVIAKHELDDIVVTLPMTSESQIARIVSVGEQQGKRVKIIPDYQRFGDGKLQVDRMGSLSIISLRSLPLDIVDNKVYKRTFDVIFSLLVIVFVFTWLFPLISLIVKLSSKGPVFFKQERWGLNNKTIVCFKFRSMVASSKDVDDKGNYLQASKNDPRITRIGRFLRKTNLDELPQFFNVLLGSMSVVGPRPHPVPLNMASKDSVENYMKRHWVKPGITGWAQVNGYRGETREPSQMKKRVKLDLWYIENWTFWLDLQIIVQTLVNMVKGEKNAF
ncbi:MAG TPA: undecaprenyl-phosphate glucose phosphotransferase [Flavisolibacter sp.]|nr:undecaprenyl-phosphate glucose phosphotransferase [Flavisolibacter sp.]